MVVEEGVKASCLHSCLGFGPLLSACPSPEARPVVLPMNETWEEKEEEVEEERMLRLSAVTLL